MTWDKRLDYDAWNKKFKDELKLLKKDKELCELKHKPVPKMVSAHLAYNAMLATQLENGSRISEATEALVNYSRDNNREQKVRARKRKKQKKDKKTGEVKIVGRDVLVLIIIPPYIKKHYLDGISNTPLLQLINRVKLYAINHYKINTHSLRYACIAKRGREKVPANIISKAIRHTNISMIERYTAEDEADDFKRSWIK